MGDRGDFLLDFFIFDELPSTQDYALTLLKNSKMPKLPFCVIANRQTQGRGSRGNVWESEERALLFSFVFDLKKLPRDLPLQSLSLYVGVILQEFLHTQGAEELWIKWPNDLYIQDKKIGGILTQCVGNICVCGIGINLKSKKYGSLTLEVLDERKEEFIHDFLLFFFKFPTWQVIFDKYKLEFHKNFSYHFHHQNQSFSFKDAVLCEDGAIMIDDEKIYSLR